MHDGVRALAHLPSDVVAALLQSLHLRVPGAELGCHGGGAAHGASAARGAAEPGRRQWRGSEGLATYARGGAGNTGWGLGNAIETCDPCA